MANIIRKVTLASDGPGSWTGERYAEILVERNGKEVYASLSRANYDGLYFITAEPVLEYHMKNEAVPNNLIIESFETGDSDDYEKEEKMAQSDYYTVFLYLNSMMEIADKLEQGETSDYTEDLGRDTDKMNLKPLASESRLMKQLFGEVYPGYTVLSIQCEEAEDDIMQAYNAEAVVIDHNKTVYLEATWVSEVPEEISFEKNKVSIHEQMTRPTDEAIDELVEIRQSGLIYSDMHSALSSKYSSIFRKLIIEIFKKLREAEYFEDFADDEDEIPSWYKWIEKDYNTSSFVS